MRVPQRVFVSLKSSKTKRLIWKSINHRLLAALLRVWSYKRGKRKAEDWLEIKNSKDQKESLILGASPQKSNKFQSNRFKINCFDLLCRIASNANASKIF